MRPPPGRTAADTTYPPAAQADCPVRPARTGALLAAALPLLWGATQPAFAGAVYKTVDSEGRVTYSATPPVGDGQRVEQLKIDDGMQEPPQPEPDAAAIREARAKAVSAAQQGVIRAKAALEQAKIQSPEDWETKPDGKRVLSAAYFNRVSAAEAEVELAERSLEQARK